MNEFEKNKEKRVWELIEKINELMDEYHAELYLNNDVYKAFGQLNAVLINESKK